MAILAAGAGGGVLTHQPATISGGSSPMVVTVIAGEGNTHNNHACRSYTTKS